MAQANIFFQMGLMTFARSFYFSPQLLALIQMFLVFPWIMPLCVYGLSVHHCNLSVSTFVLILEKNKSSLFWNKFLLEIFLKASFICKDRTSAESCYKYYIIFTKTLAVLSLFFPYSLSLFLFLNIPMQVSQV